MLNPFTQLNYHELHILNICSKTELSVYGLRRKYKEADINNLLKKLIELGYIHQSELFIYITKKGLDYLNQETNIK